jgi:hypothetical protein
MRKLLGTSRILAQVGRRRGRPRSLNALHDFGEKLEESGVVAIMDVLDVPES